MLDEKTPKTAQETKEKALRLLGARSYGTEELRRKLLLFGYPEDGIEEALSFCTEYGFLDDSRYSRALAADLSNLKKYGKRRIRAELYHRGLGDADVEQALAGIEDDDDELRRLIEKKLGGNFDKKSIDKSIRYFLYRGYEFYDIKRITEELKADEL